MIDLLAQFYPWILAFHVISVFAWMAGLFYLPRLFVYHVERVEPGSPTEAMFADMERRLIRAIMNPAMTAAWIFGLCLVFTPGIVDWSMTWPWVKAASVIAMTVFHHWLSLKRKAFARGENRLDGRSYRIANELPTVLLIVIVVSVIVKY